MRTSISAIVVTESTNELSTAFAQHLRTQGMQDGMYTDAADMNVLFTGPTMGLHLSYRLHASMTWVLSDS